MPAPHITIVYQDRHVVVVVKPPGIDVHGRGPEDRGTLVALVAAQLGVPPRKLHPAARLDRPVSGLVPLARSRIGRKALTEQYQARLVRRTYRALVGVAPQPGEGQWDAPMGPDRRRRGHQVIGGPGAKPARTCYRTEAATEGGAALVELSPRTGRTHQLRVHLAAAGCPVLGDRRYGGVARWTLADGSVEQVGRVMLHAARLEWLAPEGGGRLRAEAALPDDMAALYRLLITKVA